MWLWHAILAFTDLPFSLFILKADEYDSRQNEVVKNEELTYNNHSTTFHHNNLSAVFISLIIILLRTVHGTS